VPGEADLTRRYRPLALGIARDWFLPGSDPDDVRQEAMLGLLVGIRSYQPERGIPLATYLRFSVRMWLAAAAKMANAEKHGPLNTSARVVVGDEDESAIVDVSRRC